jgi:Cu2+-exporting ATPase
MDITNHQSEEATADLPNEHLCFHCQDPVPPHWDEATIEQHSITYQQRRWPTCCIGCQTVAKAIISQGLAAYYEQRDQLPKKPASELISDEVAIFEQLRLFDDIKLQDRFVITHDTDQSLPSTHKETMLLMEGMTCAACVWLNEQHLLRLNGIISARIHFVSHRATVVWDTRKISLSQILKAVAQIGYTAHPYSAAKQTLLRQKARKMALLRLWCAGLSMMQVMMFIFPLYLAKPSELAETQFIGLLHTASLLLTLPVVFFSAWPFYRGFLRDIKTRHYGMDTPIALGVITAFLGSLWAWWHGALAHIYFDAIAMFVFLLLGSRYLATLAQEKAFDATDGVKKLQVSVAHRLPAWPQREPMHTLPLHDVRVGDVVWVRAGERVPVDGVIIDGATDMDESLLTGESLPNLRSTGDTVIAGSLSLTQAVAIRVQSVGEATCLAQIERLLERASLDKPRWASMADRMAHQFVVTLLLVSLLTLALWLWMDADQALWVVVAVLVVSCPCALSLATPAALTTAIGHLSRLGLIVRQGASLEAFSVVTDIVFDKTGTLSTGQLNVIHCDTVADYTQQEALQYAILLESGSVHPIAQAFRRSLPSDCLLDKPLSDALQHAGLGIEACVDGQYFYLGHESWLAAQATAKGGDWQHDLAKQHETLYPLARAIYLAEWQSQSLRTVAVFYLADTVRDGMQVMSETLRQAGYHLHLISGDDALPVADLAEQLGISKYQSRCLPADKWAYVQALQAQGKTVLMVGDRVNDAPVLAGANVAMAMGSGADLAQAAGDMIIWQNQLHHLPQALALGIRVKQVIHQNLTWAVAYNVAALPLAMSGHLTPALASLGMALSSLAVMANALRLLPPRTLRINTH